MCAEGKVMKRVANLMHALGFVCAVLVAFQASNANAQSYKVCVQKIQPNGVPVCSIYVCPCDGKTQCYSPANCDCTSAGQYFDTANCANLDGGSPITCTADAGCTGEPGNCSGRGYCEGSKVGVSESGAIYGMGTTCVTPPGVKVDEVCGDGEDNDCDGVIDDQCQPEALDGGFNPPCDSCKETHFADPLDVAGGNSYVSILDEPLPDPELDLDFKRVFNSDPEAWRADQALRKLPKPFGGPFSDGRSMLWSHSYYSFVFEKGPLLSVRDTAGGLLRFNACSGVGCWATPADLQLGLASRLQKTEKGYRLVEQSGRELVFENPIAMEAMKPHHFFLTEIRSRGRTAATLIYRPLTSSDRCYAEMAGLVGNPLLSEVRTRSGAAISFTYYALYTGTVGPERCFISNLGRRTGTDTTGNPTYTYAIGYNYGASGSETPGKIQSVTYNTVRTATSNTAYATRTESYTYSGGEFTRTRTGGLKVMRHTYDLSGRVSASTAMSDNITMVWGGTASCDANSACCADPLRSERAMDGNSGRGDGLIGTSSLVTQFDVRENTGERLEPTLYRTTNSCSVPNSCSPGSIVRAYTCPGEGGLASHLQGVQDKRGVWTAYENRAPPEGSPANQMELAAVRRGATDKFGSGALETTYFTYGYGPTGEQRVETESQSSALLPGDVSRRRRVYESVSGRLSATFESGWTQVFDPSSGTSTPLKRTRATFYFTNRVCSAESAVDPFGRVLEVHGPCWVNDENATDCRPTDSVAVTQYAYYDAAAGFPNAHQLKSISQYPAGRVEGCSQRTPLVTRFDLYSNLGLVRSVTDPNGVVTQIEYVDRRVQSVKVGQALATEYAYDGEFLTAIRRPKGNYEVFCYRDGTGYNCDGQLTGRLQWRSKATSASGTSFSEKIFYEYWPDGTIKSESYRLPCPSNATGCVIASGVEIFRKEYAADAHRRPTWSRTGTGPSAFVETKAYDGADNMVGLGLAFNEPPAWCGGVTLAGLPASPACQAMEYDRASRMTSTVGAVDADGTAVRTCFDHDPQGNIAAVKTGCSSGDACSACAQPASRYVTDDFGNLVSVTLPHASGPVLREFGPRGELLREQTPQQRLDGVYLERLYDALGRLTELRSQQAGASSQALFRMGYDADGALDSSCPQPVNTLGRLRWREDSFGRTWYSYSPEGWLLSETRVRAGRSTCGGSIDDSPHTVYGRDANGNVTSVRYPHGRTVTYQYGSNENADRVTNVTVSAWDGAAWSSGISQQLIWNVKWMPYGGILSYQIYRPGTYGNINYFVEYLLGGDPTQVPAAGGECTASRPVMPGDSSGRLRGLWVSSNNTSPTGDVYRRTLTWKADQVLRSDTCVLGSVQPKTEVFTYDSALRLRSATAGAAVSSLGGSSYSGRSYSYGPVGERTALTRDCASGQDVVQLAFSPETGSTRLVSARSSCDALVTDAYQYDADGRVATKTSADGVEGSSGFAFAYGESGAGASGSATVFKTVQVNGATYSYYFDAFNRRRLKVYPTGVADEFYHDAENQLLSDRGNRSLLAGDGYVEDDYVWLGGRPVIMVRGRFDANWKRLSDATADCSRLGDGMACGAYHLITDQLGKVVLALTAAGRVAGVSDYDPFGHLNRVQLSVGSDHPYVPGGAPKDLGTYARAVGTKLKAQMRFLFGLVDTEQGNAKAVVRDGAAQSAWTVDVGGPARGRTWTQWLTPSNSSVSVSFSPGSACVDGPFSPCPTQRPYNGVTLDAYEYRVAEPGIAPITTPLRFPGQYHDAETDLFENWNRYYDPSIGRYLQPEPMLQNADFAKVMAQRGVGAPAYGFAANNPIQWSDASGLYVIPPKDPRFQELLRRLQESSCGRVVLNMLEKSPVHFLFDDGKIATGAPGQVTVRQVGSGSAPDIVGIRLDFTAPIGAGSLFAFAHELGHALDLRRGVTKKIIHSYNPSCFRDNGRACQCRRSDSRDYIPEEEWADKIARCVTEGTFGGDPFDPDWN